MEGKSAPKNAPRLGPATMSALRIRATEVAKSALRAGHSRAQVSVSMNEVPTCSHMRLEDDATSLALAAKCLPSPGGWEDRTKVKVDLGQTRAQVPVSENTGMFKHAP